MTSKTALLQRITTRKGKDDKLGSTWIGHSLRVKGDFYACMLHAPGRAMLGYCMPSLLCRWSMVTVVLFKDERLFRESLKTSDDVFHAS